MRAANLIVCTLLTTFGIHMKRLLQFEVIETVDSTHPLIPSRQPQKHTNVSGKSAGVPGELSHIRSIHGKIGGHSKAPVLVLSLPKSGTTSLHKYFKCGGSFRAAHYWSRQLDGPIGICMEKNMNEMQPLLHRCGGHPVWSDLGYAQKHSCYYAGLDPRALSSIATHYPRATIVMGTRPPQDWMDSVSSWAKGTLLKRWRDRCPVFPNSTDEFPGFYERYTETIRNFAAANNLRYIEIGLSDPASPIKLEKEFGIPVRCYQKCRPMQNQCDPATQ